jgi:hypothetical protein
MLIMCLLLQDKLYSGKSPVELRASRRGLVRGLQSERQGLAGVEGVLVVTCGEFRLADVAISVGTSSTRSTMGT